MVTFEVLGPVRVRAGTRELRLGGQRPLRLLAALLLTPDQSVAASYLVDTVWDDNPPATARRQLQNALSALRRDLGGGAVIVGDKAGYRIRLGRDELDARVFADRVQAATEAEGGGRVATAAALLREALSVWRGPALSGCTGRRIEAAAARLDEQRLAATEQVVELELRLGRHRQIVAEVAGLVAAHPLRERLIGQLMLALYRSGRQAEALEAYQRLRRTLADELGLEPGEAVRKLHTAILRNDPIALPEPPVRLSPRLSVLPRQLPAPPRHFVGRAAQLATLTSHAGAPYVVSGPAGIGKTALVLRWANEVAGYFPNGQLYVDLRGFATTGAAMRPAQAIRGFLDALGVAPEQVPSTLDARVGLYRSLLAGRRMLVVLDNAADAEQVRPLIPGSGSCLAVITSRCRLTGLITDGARSSTVESLSPEESCELLAQHLGPERLAAEPRAVDQIVQRCAGLPLALAVVAARAQQQPTFPLAAFAAELADAGRSLDALDGGDPTTRIRAAFSSSYRRLSADAARLFRMLGAHTGPDITAPTAASLATLPETRARAALGELAQAHLVVECPPGRFALTGLLLTYAVELATSQA